MTPTNEQPDALERLIDRTLRAQPSVRAPRTLEARVLAQIEGRASLAWWEKGFTHWPMAARAVFVAASLVIVKFAIDAAMWATAALRGTPVTQALDVSAEKVDVARSVFMSIADIGAYLVQGIPSYWLYVGTLGCVAAYVTCFGLGAAVYKALYK